MSRLPPRSSEWIDRANPIEFSFEGRRYRGFAGDTVSSALWAAGVRVLGRSFKYHRPRGLLSFANHDINAMMQNGQRLNLRADVTPLEPGMDLSAINTWGSVVTDPGRILDKLSPLLPVGFYYKAFHSKRLFPLWEKMFRRITGLGTLDLATPHIRTAKRYDFCDVLIIGGGPSGLSAALAAAENGCDVVIVDENPHPGGSGCYRLGGEQANLSPVKALVAQVQAHPRIRLQSTTLAAGYYIDHWIPLLKQDHLVKMRAGAVVIATGSYEQPAVFRNNDLPGVMLASASQRLIHRYAVRPMETAVVLTANRDGYVAALDLLAAGVRVQAVADLRNAPADAEMLEALRARGVTTLPGHCIHEALPNRVGDGLEAVQICSIGADGEPRPAQANRFECDGVVMSVGYAPAANLLYQAGARMRFDATLQQFVPEQLPKGVFACGQVNGLFTPAGRHLDGQRAGLAAAAYLGRATAPTISVPQEAVSPNHAWPIVPHAQGKNFVDFDEDIQLKDFHHAIQEGFDNIELMKRYTTVGMGPSQGKHSNMNALRILARATGMTPGEVGTTTARPFVHPVPLSHLAGRGFTPQRLTPLHARHEALQAQFMPAGPWLRPEYYRRPHMSRAECISQEVACVRSELGIIDVGTLGKLELRGPDAAEFLERVYISRYGNLKVGMTRYAVMCDESGVVVDDGVVARLGEEHFYFTTTTSGAANIYRELSRLNAEWRLDCGLTNLTGARAAVNLAGPNSRAVLATLTDLDLSAAAFPYLGVRRTEVAGIPALIMRVGFVGEWGYEIHVPASQGPALWDALMEAGRGFGIRPFGVEAQRLLRLEKGHIIIGQDTDGLTTPFDANLAWAVKLDKPFFIGQRTLKIHAERKQKQQLVGFTLDRRFDATPPQECHLVIHVGDIAGRVTSIGWSAALGHHVGLAYVTSDLAWLGARFTIRLSDGSLVEANVCKTPFYDPDNLRQKEVAG
jgi:sarcosine oxidase subunit alpha